MMKLIRLLAFIPILLFAQHAEAQFFKKLKKRAERAAEETIHRKAEQKTAQKTEEVMDSIFDAQKKEGKRTKGKKGNEAPSGNNGQNGDAGVDKGGDDASASQAKTVFSTYTKFDFEAGEKIIAYEDFSSDEIGDLPARWNSSNSAEVVTLSAAEGKWMKIGKGKGSFVPDFITDFPENFTLEYDVIFDFDVSQYIFLRFLLVNFSDLENPNYDMNQWRPGKSGITFRMEGGISSGGGVVFKKYVPNQQLNQESRKKASQFSRDNSGRGKTMHVALWKQGKRLRVYLDEDKIFDIPRAFENPKIIKSMRWFSEISDDDNYYFLSNIRYAVGKADTRSKLLNDGRLVTYGITFDSGSAQLRPESYGVLKKIAEVIKENNITVNIIGHTDGDGDTDFNQKLSELRATAVKTILVSEFGVDGSSLTAEGRGESKPIAGNESPEGKAKNRRVEFIKL
ncbi:MAG: OmpA family protein [Bacteroidota bacterium]